MTQNPIDFLYAYLFSLWGAFVALLFKLIGAVIVVLVGIIVAWAVKHILRQALDALKIDDALTRLGFREFFERGGLRLNAGAFVGEVIFWLLLVVFLMTGFEVVGLKAVNDFLQQIVNYLPNAIAAGVIIVVTAFLGEVVGRWVRGLLRGGALKGAQMAGTLAKWGIVIFGLLAALHQLGVAREVIQIVLVGLVAMLAVSGGIAFGLGGQEYARFLVDKLRKELHE